MLCYKNMIEHSEVFQLIVGNITVVTGMDDWFPVLTVTSLILCYVISWRINSQFAEVECYWTISFEYIAIERMSDIFSDMM